MPHCLQPGQGVPVTPDHWMMDLFFCFMKLKLSYFLINPGRGHLALHKVLALTENTPGSGQRRETRSPLTRYCQAQAQAQALRHSGSQALRLNQAQSGSIRLSQALTGSLRLTQALTQWQWQWPRAWADTKILEATTTTHHHHYPPPTFKCEGGDPHKNPKSKTDSGWSPLPNQHKKTRWTARGSTWGSPTCSRRTSST